MKRTNHCVRARRGVSALIAMMYLTLFATLAVGFYATTNTSAQVSNNDQVISRALVAAETGMDFARFHLRQLTIPAACPESQLMNEVHADLAAAINNTGNLKGGQIGYSNGVITIPASAGQFIETTPGGPQFRLTIEQVGQRLKVRAFGRADATDSAVALDRGVQLEYGIAQNASSIFDFGVATRSRVSMNSNARIRGATDSSKGSVMVATDLSPAMTMNSNAEITGDLSFTNPSANFTYGSNAKVGGYNVGTSGAAAHTHYGISPPEFPVIDTAVFAPFATNVLTIAGKKYDNQHLSNIRIKANTNPTFDGNGTVKGVIYIETPNKVTFNSNTQITGVIVVQNNPTGNPSTNTLTFDSNVTIKGVEYLDPAVFGNLTQLKGAVILAPKFFVRFNSNFGSAGGSIVASKMQFDSNAKGTVHGSVINLDDTAVSFDGNSEITIQSSGTSNYPAGVYFGSHYVPLPDTYEELRS